MQINRLIIIGNGFDIAHDLKTSCKDFIIDYLSKVWGKLSVGYYDDKLLKIGSAKNFFQENDLSFSDKTAIKLYQSILKSGSYRTNEPHLLIHSNFFKSVFTKLNNLNWADIETEYYNELIQIIEKSHREKPHATDRIVLEQTTTNSIISLNEDLDYLQELLIKYLQTQEEDFAKRNLIDSRISKCFNEKIFEGEENKTQISNNKEPNQVLYLNFNYTNILSKYCNGSNLISIHGTLDDNPIFGFGDDTSEKYKMLENEYNNEILKKIKSFKYLNNSRYTKLLNFINQGRFQVHIYGHSCGVSDRTLFKQIFENENCKWIKIFYYNEKDFEEKKFEISRHFENKNMFLEKIISFNNLRKMPQPKELIKPNR